MWKYIVTWCLINTVPTSCPDAEKPDEFGRIINSGTVCAALHWKTEKDCDHSKEFDNREDAISFIRRANEEINNSFYQIIASKIDSVRLDSVWVENKNK